LSQYLDANAIIALLTADPLTPRVRTALGQGTEPLIISDFAAAEFTAVVGRKMRSATITRQHALDAITLLDQWSTRTTRARLDADDVARAEQFLRRLDLPLQTPDAVHIAIAERLEATLVTFDRQMAAAARTLGLLVAGA